MNNLTKNSKTLPNYDIISRTKKDIRFIEGLKAFINCGVFTAICPAAAFNNYDPRQIVDTVQHGNEAEIE